MNKNLKIGLILLIVASVYFLCSAVAFFIIKESENEKRIYLEEELKEIVAAKEAIALDLSEIKSRNRQLENKLSSVKEQARSISDEILREKEARRLLASQLEAEKKKAERLMADVMTEKEERLNLVYRLSKAEDSYGMLKDQFELMLQAKETLEKKLRDMMAGRGVELERIEVKSEYRRDDRDYNYEDSRSVAAEVAPEAEYTYYETEETRDAGYSGLSGRRKLANVMVVNKKYNFIVSNVGKSDGLEIGSQLDIYRSDTFIAKTQVEKLYDKMSASTILPEWRKARIREGDQVFITE